MGNKFIFIIFNVMLLESRPSPFNETPFEVRSWAEVVAKLPTRSNKQVPRGKMAEKHT